MILVNHPLGVVARFHPRPQFGAVQAHAGADFGQHGRVAQIGAGIPVGGIGGAVVLQKLALLLGILGGLQGVEAVGRVAGRAHYQVGGAGLAAEGVGQFVRRLAGARFTDAAFQRRVRAQQVGAAFHGDVVFLFQPVDAFQADIAPGSNVIVPDDDIDRAGVVRVAVGRRRGIRGSH